MKESFALILTLPGQAEIVAEHNDLKIRTDKLKYFIGSAEFKKLNTGEADRLQRQLEIMESYLVILRERLAAFVVWQT